MKYIDKKNNKGFTIIEVLIVLAIAGLIMLVVFLAIPALERNTRNNGRKNDASRIASAIGDFVSNNSGTLPTPGAGGTWDGAATNCATIATNAGSLSQFTSTVASCIPGVQANSDATSQFGIVNVVATATAPALPTAIANQLILYTGATCNGEVPKTGLTNQAALAFSIEPGSGNWLWDCIDAQ